MRRRSFLFMVPLGVLSAPLAATAQPAGKMRRIGYLGSGATSSAASAWFDAFRQGLRELGWAEGENVVLDRRSAEGRFDRLPDFAAELVRLGVEIIVAAATPAAVAARNATGTIPIVMINAGDPVGIGLVESLARPGGNVTGLAYSVGLETLGKGLELLRETVPNLRHVAVLSNPANPGQAVAIAALKTAAEALGLQLQLLEARGPDAFDDAFAAMARERAEAVVVVVDSITIRHGERLAALAASNRLPSLHGVRASVEAGGLMSYGVSFHAQFRRAAVYVDKILRGAKPADLPVEQPSKFELVINLRTAKALGIEIPAAVLARADEVIE